MHVTYPVVTDQTYVVGDPHTEYRFNLFSVFPSDCGAMTYYYGIYYQDSLTAVSSEIGQMFNATILDLAPRLQIGQFYEDNSILEGLSQTYLVNVFISLKNQWGLTIY